VCVGAALLPQGTHILEYLYLILGKCSKIMRSISVACQSFTYVLNTMNNEHYTRSAWMFRIFFIMCPETRKKKETCRASLLSSNYTFRPTLSPVTRMSNISKKDIMIALISLISRFFFPYFKFRYRVQGASNCSYTMTG
jgi:hypothetical protein